MHKVYLYAALVGIVIILASCSTVQTTVIPRANGNYEVIATAANSASAQQGAIDKATKVCQQQNKSLIVKKNHTIYQGAGKELGELSQAFSTAASMNSHTYVPTTKSTTDYKTTTTFQCH